jgi:hypothetical protein
MAMKFKKVFAAIGALCLSATLLTSVFVGAVNFDKATYAEDNPTYVEIISKNENELVFGPTEDNMPFKALLHASDLVGQENVSKIRNIKMTITYSNTAKVPTSYIGGSVWTEPGQKEWSLSMMDAETGEYKEASYDVELKFLLDTKLLTPQQEGIVIQDWSYKSASEATQLENAKMKTNGFQIKVTNLKIYSDVAGTQEMELMPYGYPEVAPTTTPAATETTVAATTTTAAAAVATTTTGSAAGTTTTAAKSTNPTTGEKGIAIAIASLMAAAGVAVIFKKDRK